MKTVIDYIKEERAEDLKTDYSGRFWRLAVFGCLALFWVVVALVIYGY